ncbi:MAG: extracellular catalytic domain type 1 short-chain-length polyhydroxyalkanoate depolymerase [Vulcanimicrobiaceae bacterium]
MNHRLYVPEQHGKGAPLLVALHGCRQDAEDFAHGTRFDAFAQRYGAIVLYPEQDERRNGHRCWNWFLPENQRRDGPEPRAILELVERTIREHDADRSRVFVAGLSAGACVATILAEQAPDVFSGVGAMAGVALHCAHDVETAYAAMRGEREANDVELERHFLGAFRRSRAMFWTGTDDRRVAPRNSRRLAEQFARLFALDSTPDEEGFLADGRCVRWHDRAGRARIELREIPGAGHAWSGGSLRGSYTAPAAPSFSDAFFTFFLSEETEEMQRCG